MKKNRIIATLMLLCLTATLLCGAAFADVIYAPTGDSFFNSHEDACTYEGREYYANGPTGYLDLYTEPNGSVIGQSENREDYVIQYTYLDGTTQWGLTLYKLDDGKLESTNDWNGNNAWVKLSDMTLKYDSIEFQKDYAGEIVSAESQKADLSGLVNKEIVLWTYPHSGDDIEDDFMVTADYPIEFDSYYTDGEGLLWGHCTYYMAIKDFWVCISNPTTENLSVVEQRIDFFTPGPGGTETTTPQPTTAPAAPAANNMTLYIIIGVAAVVIIALVVMLIVKSRNGKKEEAVTAAKPDNTDENK